MNTFIRKIKKVYKQAIKSFAFIPALIAIFFLAFSVLMLKLDFSTLGKHIKASVELIRLKDANTARSIVSTILAGIISLSVFSFSNVMLLLSQAASQLSNRILQTLIQNRFQQTVLGFYIGTIVYSLFLLSSIRDVDAGVYVPALSIYLLIIFTIADIFLFIYFLHYVTQTVKFNTVIKNIYKKTIKEFKKVTDNAVYKEADFSYFQQLTINTPESNYYQGCDYKKIIAFAKNHNAVVEMLHPIGAFLLIDTPVMRVSLKDNLSEKDKKRLIEMTDLYNDESIDIHFYYGFHQLAEVALKALSPGINDPQTAVLCIHALTDLFLYLMNNKTKYNYVDEENTTRLIVKERSFDELFKECFDAIWNYGKDDLYIQEHLLSMLQQLKNKAGIQHFNTLDALVKKVGRKAEITNY